MSRKKENYKVFPFWQARICSAIVGLRKRYQNPNEILLGYITEGMTVADIGCALGYFTLPMAEMVGRSGKVVAVDLQPQMLEELGRKAKKVGVWERIKRVCCSEHSLNIDQWKEQIDFALVFAVAHEVPDRERLFRELYAAMKGGARLLLAEPKGHVSEECFRESVAFAKQSGFQVIGVPNINMSRAVLLAKQ